MTMVRTRAWWNQSVQEMSLEKIIYNRNNRIESILLCNSITGCSLFYYFYFILFYSGRQGGQGLSEHVKIPPTAEGKIKKHCFFTQGIETRCCLTHSGYETNIRNISSDTFIFPVAWSPTDQTQDHNCRYNGPTQGRWILNLLVEKRQIWPYQIALARINPSRWRCEAVKAA